jgi:hypothetical protein
MEDIRIITPKSALPKFLLTHFVNGINPSQKKFLLVYSGYIEVGHGAEDDTTAIRIEYPLLGWFKNGSGIDTEGILPFDDPDLMESAVGSLGYASFHIKDTDSYCGIDWPAPGSEDTELGVLMELEVGHGETEVYPRVQA